MHRTTRNVVEQSVIPPPTSQPQDNEGTPSPCLPTTRFGRVVKKPTRYSPQERCEDDYASDEYDSHESDISSEMSCDPDDFSSESDADENGNLAGFVVKSDESDDDSDVPASSGGSSDDE